MLRRVLVATNLSVRAQRAEALAGRVVAGSDVEVELFYVYPELPPRGTERQGDRQTGMPWCVGESRLAPYVVERATTVLRAAGARLSRAAGTNPRIWYRIVGSDDVAAMIVHEAERGGVDLIVLGGRKHTELPFLNNDGVCGKVRRRTQKPVLLVP